MMTSHDIRHETRKILWKEHGFLRLFPSMLLLAAILVLVGFGMRRLFPFCTEDVLAESVSWRFVLIVAFCQFVQTLFSGIAAFGASRAFLSVARGTRGSVLSISLEGFSRPFHMFWAGLLLHVTVLIRTFVVLLPLGLLLKILVAQSSFPYAPLVARVIFVCVALCVVSVLFYRYMQFWFVRADYPEIPVSAVLSRTVGLAKGNVKPLVALDCGYWPLFIPLGVALGWVLSPVVQKIPLSILPPGLLAGLFAGLVVVVVLLVVLMFSMGMAHAVYYRELVDAPRS